MVDGSVKWETGRIEELDTKGGRLSSTTQMDVLLV